MQQIRIQSFVLAPPPDVWPALRDGAAVVLDALPEPRWPEPVAASPPARLAVPWPHTAALGAPSEVVVELEAAGGGTRVDLRHRGLGEGPGWDEAVGGYFAAWLQALAALGTLVESGVDARATPAFRGGERYFASGEIPGGADAVWRSLTDPHVLARWSDGVLEGARPLEAREGRFLRLALAGPDALSRELTLILRPTPRGTHLALAEYGVREREASLRWPPLFERLAHFLG